MKIFSENSDSRIHHKFLNFLRILGFHVNVGIVSCDCHVISDSHQLRISIKAPSVVNERGFPQLFHAAAFIFVSDFFGKNFLLKPYSGIKGKNVTTMTSLIWNVCKNIILYVQKHATFSKLRKAKNQSKKLELFSKIS